MNINSIFRQGSGHKVCQDYARHTEKVALLSDGCSGSPDTDFGSRQIVIEAMKYLSYPYVRLGYDNINHALETAAFFAKEKLKFNGLSERSCDATLGGIFIDGEIAKVFLYGDGYIISKQKDSSQFRVDSFHFNTKVGNILYETPVYPIYKFEIKNPSFYVERTYTWYSLDNCEILESDIHKSEAEQKCSYQEYIISDYDLIAVASDGLGTFKNDIAIVVQELFDIKSKKGVYLERHYNAYLKENNDMHTDDLSIVSVLI